MSASGRPGTAPGRPRSTSPTSPISSSWRPAAIPGAIPAAGSWPRPTWPWCPPTSSRASPRTPRGTAVGDLPPTAFDHGSIAESGRDRLRAKLSYTNIGFALAPPTFTIAQLRDIYATSLGHPLSATNLQRVLTRRGVIEATPAAARPTSLGGRPATLYRFASRTLVVTNPFAAFRPPSLLAKAAS